MIERFFAVRTGGFERLFYPVFVFAYQRVAHGEDLGRGAVIFVEDDGFRVREKFVEVVEKADVCAAPGIDGLIGIAHDKEVFMLAGESARQFVLFARDVLKFVYLHIFELILPFLQGGFAYFEQI